MHAEFTETLKFKGVSAVTDVTVLQFSGLYVNGGTVGTLARNVNIREDV